MKKSAAWLLVASFAVLLSACKSPRGFCKKVSALTEQESKDGKPFTDKQMEECEKEAAEIKKASPEGFACMFDCLDIKSPSAAGVCVLECDQKDEKLRARREEKSKQRESDRMSKLSKRVDEKEKPFEGSIKGLDNKAAKFSITLVEGFTEDRGGESARHFEFKGEDDEPSGPSVTVRAAYQDSLEEALKNASGTVVKKDSTPTGYIIVQESDDALDVEVLVKAGENKLQCDAHLFNSKAGELKEKLLPWMEKMCTSLKPEFVEAPIVTWSKLPEKLFEGQLKGYDGTSASFSIGLVEGFKEDKSFGESMRNFKIDPEGLNPTISVRVGFGYDDDIDKAAQGMETGATKITKKEKTETGFVIHSESDGIYAVKVNQKFGDKHYSCEANLFGSLVKEHKGVFMPFLEKLCRSLKLK